MQCGSRPIYQINVFGNNESVGYNKLMIRTKEISLSTSTASLLRYDDEVKRSASVSVQNNSSTQNVYIGTSSVSSSSYGILLTPGQTLTIDLGHDDDLYAVGDSGATVTVLVLDK